MGLEEYATSALHGKRTDSDRRPKEQRGSGLLRQSPLRLPSEWILALNNPDV
jgi:hypothetical protein